MARFALMTLALACAPKGPEDSAAPSTPGPRPDTEQPVDTDTDADADADADTDTDADTDADADADTDTDTGDTAAPDPCAPDAGVTITALWGAPSPTQPLGLDLEVALSSRASLAVACTNTSDPEDVLFWEFPAASYFEQSLYGFVDATTYSCAIAPTCPRATAAPSLLVHTTPAMGSDIGRPYVTHNPTRPTTGPAFLGINHWRYCDGAGPQRLIVYDIDGRIRWVYEDIPSWINMGIQFEYFGSGLFAWGGGEAVDAAPRLVGVDGVEQYRTLFPGARDLIFHHDGRRLDDGRILTLTHATNYDGAGNAWTGFGVQIHTPGGGLDWSYDSQNAVDLGLLPTGSGDVYHANWVDHEIMPDGSERVYVSLCYLYQVLAIDVASGDAQFVIGRNGSFDLQTPGGAPLSGAEFSQCQHGLEVEGNRILYYDNGWERGYSRASEIEFDEATRTAKLLWTWRDDPWYEGALGDADRIAGGTVMVTQAHTDCWGSYGDESAVVEFDPATGEQIWRFEFTHVNDNTYRSERMEACDVFPVTAYCDDAAARYAELADVLHPCDPADRDGDGLSACDGDCDNRDPNVFPGAPEICDGVDQGCDGVIDDDPTCYACSDDGTWLACADAVDWNTAEAACRSFGASLAIVDDAAANAAAAATIGAQAWIGATDFAQEGVWTWPDGTPATFSAWYAGEPNNASGEDCAGTNFGVTGQWNDYPCWQRLPFVCSW